MTQAERVAARFGVTVEQAQAQYAKNARGLRAMAGKARTAKSGKCNGYTARELERHAARFARYAGKCDDCERSYGPNYGACRCGEDEAMTAYLASGWRREVNEEYNRNDVRDRDGDIVCVVWDDGDGSFTVQGWDAEWEQCEEDDSHNFATLAEAEADVARRVAEFEAGGDTCDDCARSYGPHAPCRCGND